MLPARMPSMGPGPQQQSPLQQLWQQPDIGNPLDVGPGTKQ